ncbi:MAG: radical SAM protein [Planctomycetota bacterium]
MTLAAPVPTNTKRSASRVRRIVLVQTHQPFEQLTHVHPVGLLSLAACARARGYGDVHVLDMKALGIGPEEAIVELERLAPDVVGLSGMTFEAKCIHAVARLVRERLPKAFVIAGGPHASVAADDVLADPAVDLVIRGEAEESFPAVLDGLSQGRTDWTDERGLTWRNADGAIVREPDRAPPDDLDALPMPAWDLVDHARYRDKARSGVIRTEGDFATMFSSRACPWRCTYCHNSYGKTFRERSAASVLAEIDHLVERYNVKELVFLDDIFNFKPARAKAIARGLIERGYDLRLSFPNGFRGDHLDEELVDLLQAAGMYRCMIAVESAVPRIQRLSKKNLKIDKVRHIAEYVARRGVLVHGAFMIGFPTETEAEMRETIDWAVRSPFHTAAFFRVIPFKGTALYEQALEGGAWLPDDWTAYEPYRSDINLSEVAEARVTQLRKRAYRRFYMRPGRLWSILKLLPNKRTNLPVLATLFARRAWAR